MNNNTSRDVLIFGGAGFIGSNLAHWFLTQTKAKVHIFDNLSRRGSQHNLKWLQQAELASKRLKVTIADIRDCKSVDKAVCSANEIYHFAAQTAVTTSVTDPRLDFEVNAGGTFNILDAARRSDKKPFLLFTSTNKVYGDLCQGTSPRNGKRYSCPSDSGISETQPLDFYSPYGCSKGAADQYVRDFGRIYDLPVVVFRMSCIAGPRQFGNEDQGWVAHFLYSALQRTPITIYGDGRQIRDVLCVTDLVRAFLAVRQNISITAGEVYNVGGGIKNITSLLELIEMIQRVTGFQLEYQRASVRPGDQLVYISDYSKLTKHTGWKPQIDVKQTVKMLLQFWQENHHLIEAAPVLTPRLNVELQLERAS